jgi:hypothetical protein
VAAELKRRGLSPTPDPPGSFQVKDTDSLNLKINANYMKA